MTSPLEFQGTQVWSGLLDRTAQQVMLDELRELAVYAPLRRYETPGGHRMSVRMSGAGAMAWMSDASGYRYAGRQPDGSEWPPITNSILTVWKSVSGVSRAPDSCLVNYYGEGARMGLHQDRDEAELDWPVVSISLGDEAMFRVGGQTRRDPTKSVWLKSGDVVVLAGVSRLAYHGIDRIKFGSSTLLDHGGRLNVTLRIAGK
ncbi:MAG: alpha-ketoglutarate-dependent dioxygenase AlkB [Pseudomonadota bacterium]